jgi:hypothetical protein
MKSPLGNSKALIAAGALPLRAALPASEEQTQSTFLASSA